jgi:hypothetical protein
LHIIQPVKRLDILHRAFSLKVSAIAADLSGFLKERSDKRKQCVAVPAAINLAFSPLSFYVAALYLSLSLSAPSASVPLPHLANSSPLNQHSVQSLFPLPYRYMTDGEKRLLDLKDACHHESKMKAAVEKAKTDAAAGEWRAR